MAQAKISFDSEASNSNSDSDSEVKQQVTSKNKKINNLYNTWKKDNSKKNYDALILSLCGLVKRLAYRFNRPDHESEDLISAGNIGMLEALKKYDETKGASLTTYGIKRINGAMKDELRNLDYRSSVKVPRSIRKIKRRIDDINTQGQKISYKDLRDILSEEFSESLVDDALAWNDIDIHFDINKDASCTDIGLISFSNDEGPTSLDIDLTIGAVIEREFNKNLVDARNRLPEREKLAVSLYHDEELKLREIGDILGVSESRASQICSQAYVRLESRMRKHKVMELN